MNSLPTNSVVDSKISSAIANISVLSAVEPEANPISFTGDFTVNEPEICLRTNMTDLVYNQHYTTPINANVHLQFKDASELDMAITGTLLEAQVDNDNFEVRFSSDADDNWDLVVRPKGTALGQTPDNLYFVSGSAEFVWGQPPIEVLKTTIDEQEYEIPLAPHLDKYYVRIEQLSQAIPTIMAQIDANRVRIDKLEDRIAKLENPE